MPNQRLTQNKIKLAALWGCIALVFFLFLPDRCAAGETQLVSGIRWNDGQLHGVHALSVDLDSNWTIISGGDIGGDRGAASSRLMLRFPLSPTVTAGLISGPNLEFTNPPNDPYTLLTYATSATGFALMADFNDRTTIWVAIDYIYPFPGHQLYKAAVGLALDIDL